LADVGPSRFQNQTAYSDLTTAKKENQLNSPYNGDKKVKSSGAEFKK